jgi:ATP-binding cassette subfamily C (CFTR/MRP) protein 4
LGKDYKQAWYDQVVYSCGLDKDFTQLIYGDSTIIGDRGVQISGGQRARISLARALYRDADLLLLDDPLSAVDSKTGRWIYNWAIQGLAIKRGATVILTTHQHQFVKSGKCVAMDKGKLIHVGTYSMCMDVLRELRSRDISANIQEIIAKDEVDDDDDVGNGEKDRKHETHDKFPTTSDNDVTETLTQDSSSNNDNMEVRGKGGVTLNTWRHYEKAIGGRLVSLILACLMLLTQAALILTVVMTASWAHYSQDLVRNLAVSLKALCQDI